METHLSIVGIIFILLAVIHIGFPAYFKWSVELKPLSLVNRQMMSIHTLFIAIMVLLMGLLCLLSPGELTHTVLGKRICIGMGIFWGIRLIVQLVGYSPRLWIGKPFETTMHVIFTGVWLYTNYVFWWVGLL